MEKYVYPEPMDKAEERIQSLILNQSLIGITEEGSGLAKRIQGVENATDHLTQLKNDGVASEDDTQALESMTRWAKGPKERVERLRRDYDEKVHTLLSVDRHKLFLKVMTVGEAEALAKGAEKQTV